MKKIFQFLFLISLLFSCQKETIIISKTELWIKVGSSIENLDISFIGTDIQNIEHLYDVKYSDGVFTPSIKQAIDNVDGGAWFLVYSSLEKSDEIVVTYNNKAYITRGFYFGERRFMEIISTLNGDGNINEYDITIIDRVIFVK